MEAVLVVVSVAAFQSPSLRGSGRFPPLMWGGAARRGGFNPLHCGAVVASGRRRTAERRAGRFQSPSLRGSGRFATHLPPRVGGGRVSIPFIAGQWSLRHRVGGAGRCRRVSIPFIAGQWSLPEEPALGGVKLALVSIPFIAGQWSLLPRTTPSSLFGVLLRKRRLPCDHIICTRLPF